MKDKNRVFLETLIDNRICGVLDVDQIISNMKLLENKLNNILNIRLKKLNINSSLNDIIKEIIDDCNYKLTLQKRNIGSESSLMQMIKKVYDYSKEIKGKDVILFLGNTGAGKSTCINYLLRTPLKYKESKVGDLIVEKIGSSRSDKKKPKIGQDIAISETLYAQGFSIDNDKPLLIVDAPGFNDARGDDHELITELSIDESIREAKNIKSIVVVLPFEAFIAEKGNGVINTIRRIKSRFPTAFNLEHPDHNRVHFIITKTFGKSKASVNGLIKGPRILSFIWGLAKFLKKHTDSNLAKERLEIWRFIREAQLNERFHTVNIENKGEITKLLERLTKYPGSVSGNCCSDMTTRNKLHLKQHIRIYIHTWKSIIDRCLNEFPNQILKINNAISIYQEEIKKNSKKEEERKSKLEKISIDQKKLDLKIKNLEKLKKDPNIDLTNELKFISPKVITDKFNQLKELENEIEIEKDRIKLEDKKIIEAEGALKELEDNLKKENFEIEKLEKEITQLSTGYATDVLWSKKWEKDQNLLIRYVDPEVVKQAYIENRELKKEDLLGIAFEGKASDFDGELIHLVLISRDYKITSDNKDISRNLIEFRNKIIVEANIPEKLGGTYKAKVEGKHYEEYLEGKNVGLEGRKIIYGFKTFWDRKREDIPSIKVTSYIPNVEFNRDSIINKRSDKNVRNNNKKELEKIIDIKKVQLLNFKTTKESMVKERNKKIEQKENLKNSHIPSDIDEIIKYEMNQLELIKEQKINLIEVKKIEIIKEKQKIEEGLKKCYKQLNDVNRKKTNASFVILRNEEQIDFAKYLSNLVISKYKDKNYFNDDEIFNQCNEFIKLYDTQIVNLKEECKRELKTAMETVR